MTSFIQVIGNLEKLLAQEVGKSRANASLVKDYKRAREDCSRLKKELAEASNKPPPPPSSDGSLHRRLDEVHGQHRAERFEDEQEMLNLQVQLKQTEERAVSDVWGDHWSLSVSPISAAAISPFRKRSEPIAWELIINQQVGYDNPCSSST